MPTTTTMSEKHLPQGDLLAWSCLEVFAGLMKSKPELLPVCDSANDAIFTRLMELDALMRLVWAGEVSCAVFISLLPITTKVPPYLFSYFLNSNTSCAFIICTKECTVPASGLLL
jgi:hypothetical protein